jgi:hypothetical protein
MKFSRVFLGVAGALLVLGSAQAADNVAPLGTASQSSLYSEKGPSRAIDGNTDGNYYNDSVMHTQAGAGYGVGNGYEWWQVSLDQSYTVDSITVWNRTDCCTGRLSDFTVSLFSGSTLEWTGVYSQSGGPLPSTTFGAIDKVGDRVMVQLNRRDYLHMAEVQVFATAVPEPETYALMLGGLAALSFVARRGRSV